MFKVRRKDTGKIHTVLDTYVLDLCYSTYFLIWENGGWRWRKAENYEPPNYKIKEEDE